MNTKRRSVAILPKIIIGIFVLAAGGYMFLYQKGKLPSPTKSIFSTHSPTPIQTENWITYSTKSYSYKLPPEVENFRCDMSACWLMSTKLPNGSIISIGGGGPGTVMSEKTWQDIREEFESKKINYLEKNFSGKEAIYLTTKENLTPFNTPYWVKNQVIQGLIINTDGEHWTSIFTYKYDEKNQALVPTEKELNTFDQILSTFKFTN